MRSSPSRAIALLPLIFLVILGCIIPSIPVATAQVASSPVTQSSVICGQVKFATVGGVLDPVLLPFDNSGVALWQPQNFNPDAYYRILDPQIAALNPPLQSQEYGPIQRHIASWSSYVQISGPNDCAAAPPPPTPTPNVSIAPTSGSAGTTVTATGTKWAPGGQVIDILWDGNQLTETNADDAGNFSFSFPIPQDAAAGDHQLTIRDGNTGFEGTARFTVTAAPPPPTPVPSAVPPTPVASSPIPTIVNASPTGLILSSIAGLVTSPDGIGLPDVKMQVTDTEGNKVKSVHTVANGEFKVSDLPPGTYIVTPNLAGYTFSPAAADPVTVPPSVKNQHFVGTSLLVPTASSIVTPIVVIPTVFPTNSPISLPATVQPVVQTPALPISTSSPTRTSAPRPASPTRTPTSALPTTNSSPSNVLGIQAGSSASNVLGIGAGVPDLTITAVELNPKTPVQGEPVQLRLTIVNKGARRLGEKWEFTGQIVLKDDKSVVVLPERDFESNHSSSITYANLDVTESWHLSIDNVYFWKGIKDGNLDITVKPKDTVTSITASQLISITPNPLQPFRCTALVASSVALILPGGSGASSFFEILGAELKAATIKGDPLSFNNITTMVDAFVSTVVPFLHETGANAATAKFTAKDIAEIEGLASEAGGTLSNPEGAIECANGSIWLIEVIKSFIKHGVPLNVLAVYSPAFPLVTNQNGQRAGFLDDGTIVEEIAGSKVVTVGEAKFVLYPVQFVSIRLKGTGNGVMTIKLILGTKEGVIQEESYTNVPVTSSMVAMIDASDIQHIMRMDMNQDGVVDQFRSPDGAQNVTATPTAGTSTALQGTSSGETIIGAIESGSQSVAATPIPIQSAQEGSSINWVAVLVVLVLLVLLIAFYRSKWRKPVKRQ